MGNTAKCLRKLRLEVLYGALPARDEAAVFLRSATRANSVFYSECLSSVPNRLTLLWTAPSEAV